ncbi:MAG: hypothetical protein FJX74_08160 [Armatimonadetes bacterium]|nr:hypothetical protein [Armatimonadota bacterium]
MRGLCRAASWTMAMMVLGLPCAAQVTAVGAYCRAVGAFDAGTIRVLVHNEGTQEAGVKTVRLNGRDLEALPNECAEWWSLRPARLPAGGYGVLSVRLSAAQAEVSVAAETDTGQTVGPLVCRRNSAPPCDLLGVRFGPRLESCYVYVRNRGTDLLTIDRVQVNGSERHGGLGGAAIVPPRGGVTCLAVPLLDGPPPGSDMLATVGLSSGEQVFAHVRAFRSVPIQAWQDADQRPEMRFDTQPLVLPAPTPGATPTAIREASLLAGYMLVDDAATADYQTGFLGAHAQLAAERSDLCRALDPTRRTLLLITQYCRELAYLCYASIPDLLIVSPYQMLYQPGSPPQANEYLFGMAREAAAPRPFGVVLEAFRVAYSQKTPQAPERERWITPPEYELNAAYAMGAGASGYFVFPREGPRGYDGNERLRDAIARTNARLQYLKPLLSLAVPSPIASTAEPNVACRALLVGDKAVLLLVINQDIARPESIWAEPIAKPHDSFVVNVEAPEWLRLDSATDLGEPGGPMAVRSGADGLALDVDRLETQRMILIHPGAVSADALVQSLSDEATSTATP